MRENGSVRSGIEGREHNVDFVKTGRGLRRDWAAFFATEFLVTMHLILSCYMILQTSIYS